MLTFDVSQKLRIDFARIPSIGRFMAQQHEPIPSRTELIQILVLEAGRLMEDHSEDCAHPLPNDATERVQRLDRLVNAAEDASTLLRAAQILNRLASSQQP